MGEGLSTSPLPHCHEHWGGKLRLGDETGAASDVLAAAKLQPNDPIGTANLALGHLLRGDIQAAIGAAREALEKHPTNANAASYLVQAHIDDSSVDDPLTLIPNELHDTAAVKIGLVNFYRRRKSSKWREAARTGASLFPDKDDLKRAAAEANLEEAFDTGGYLLGQQSVNEFDPRRLTEAAAVLHAAWNKLKASEDLIADSALPHNLAQVYRLLGKHETAAEVIDEGLRELPGKPELIKLRVVLCLATDDEESARSLLSADSNDPEIALMAAELEISRNPVAAREALAAIGKQWPDSQYAIFADFLSVESHFQEGKFDQSRELARELADKNPHNVEVLCALSSIERRTGDASASATAVRAKDELTEESSFLDRFLVAESLERLSRYDEAVDVLDGWVDSSRDTPALRLLVSALINSDRRQRANELIKSLPQSLADSPYFLRAAAAIHQNRGDLTAAEGALTQYLELCPDDLTVRLQWIDARLRRGGDEDVKNFLSGDVEALDGQPTDRMRLAHLLQHFGFAERALRLGYEVLLRHRDEPQVHLGYVGLLLRDDDVPGANLKPDEIAPDTVFVAENARSEKETYLIEPAPQLRQGEEAIPPDHLVAQKAVGLHVGESFTIDESKDPPETWKIVSIKHKWIAAVHQIMERFERRFPAVGGLERIVVETKGEKAFKTVFARVKARHDGIKSVFDQYEKNTWPLLVVAHSLGSNTIETWQGLIQLGYKFKICLGNTEERNLAFQGIYNKKCKGCVVDALTLHVIRLLDLDKPIIAVCGPIGITQSTLDVFLARLAEVLTYKGQLFMTLFYKDGQYFRDEMKAEQIDKHIQALEDDLNWIKKHCEILPAEGTQDLSSQSREIIRRVGRSFFDEILAAEGAGRLLLCEDHALRLLAAHEVGVHTSWLQPVLMVARNRGVMTLDAYSEAIISLIELGHEFISVDAQVLFAATKGLKSGDRDRFQVVAKTLGGPTAEMGSHLDVALAFLKRVWNGPVPPLERFAQTGALLECLTRERPSDFRGILDALGVLVNARAFREYLDSWKSGHFLSPN